MIGPVSGLEKARLLDASDPLSSLRKEFILPDGIIYLDGNSLGPLPVAVPPRLNKVVEDGWGNRLVRAWGDGDWWSAPVRIGDRIARLLGAGPGQVVVGESTSVQVFNALAGAARLRPERKLLITDSEHFPTDRYMAASVGRLLGLEVLEVPMARLYDALRRRGGETAVVACPAVDYRTGELWDISGITDAAHQVGAVTVWDLCHAVGATPLQLDSDAVDIAIGCTYKYLSGGPGSPAFIYVAARHVQRFDQPLSGWNGHARPFAMEGSFEPARDIARLRVGTPHVLSMLSLEAALDVFDRIDIHAIREKSLSLGDFFLSGFDAVLAEFGFEVVTPREHARRGSHISLAIPDAGEIMAAIIDRGIIGDTRPPNLIRFGFNALYVSYEDIHMAVCAIREAGISKGLSR